MRELGKETHHDLTDVGAGEKEWMVHNEIERWEFDGKTRLSARRVELERITQRDFPDEDEGGF